MAENVMLEYLAERASARWPQLLYLRAIVLLVDHHAPHKAVYDSIGPPRL